MISSKRLSQLSQFVQTIRYLKPIQIRYQIWYRIKGRLFSGKRYRNIYGSGKCIPWIDHIFNRVSYRNQAFDFLNIEHKFEKVIDWNYAHYGKLWTYNLNYFDFLNQEGMSKEEGHNLIHDFITQYAIHKDGLEPYPTSLRVINWIKFICRHEIEDDRINEVLGKDVHRLSNNLEYHLLANHLLENAFALFFAAHYFQSEVLYDKSARLLKSQLDEQILSDGAHYECSPMYHQLMLYRVLDSIHLLRSSSWEKDELLSILASKAQLMMSWLTMMQFSDGTIPLFNDSAMNINPTTDELREYFKALKLSVVDVPLSSSGYRSLVSGSIECKCDVGNIQPRYQPGHAHADTLGFILYVRKKHFLVEAGTSTYENNSRRHYERSTMAHNTVTVNGQNSSDVWSSFRVGKRAKVKVDIDNAQELKATHNGFGRCMHTRSWQLSDTVLKVVDILTNGQVGEAYFHLHPSVQVLDINDDGVATNLGILEFIGASKVLETNYQYAEEWNKYKKARVLVVNFKERLTTKISVLKDRA